MPTTELVQLGRAKNVMMSYLEERLYIPRIYLDTRWFPFPINVLAIDRDGTGDVHAAILFSLEDATSINRQKKEAEILHLFSGIEVHFKYLCYVSEVDTSADEPRKRPSYPFGDTFSADGIGRVGFLEIIVPPDGDGSVNVEVRPERFRAHIGKIADKFVQEHEADWEIRA